MEFTILIISAMERGSLEAVNSKMRAADIVTNIVGAVTSDPNRCMATKMPDSISGTEILHTNASTLYNAPLLFIALSSTYLSLLILA
jgi:hypothetical protein